MQATGSRSKNSANDRGYLSTMTKVLAARIGVDKQTLDLVFVAFGLQMERADYQQPEQNEEPAEIQTDSSATQVIDWGEAINVSMFYGRDPEITTLTTWIQQDNCRLIALLSMGGIGKTALSVKIAQQLLQTNRHFEFIVWRTLRNTPPLESLLIDIIQVLSCQQENLVSVPIPTLLNRLLYYLRSYRCLLVLDNGETILQSGEFAGVYRQDYEACGELLAIGGQDGMVQIWQAATGQLLFAIQAHTTFVLALTFSPDGKMLVSGCIGGGIKFWDVNTGECQQTWDKGRIWTLAFSPDGRLLAAGLSDLDHSICIWDVRTAECLKIFIGHSAPVCGIACAPHPIDNRQLMVTTGQDSVVKIWDVESGDCLHTLTEHTGQIWSVCFHPQGDRFATCSFDRSIKIWDVTTGACLQTLGGHTKEVSRVRFSPDGHLLVSACADRTARLWDIVSGKCLKVLQGHLDSVWAVEFTAGYLGSTQRLGSLIAGQVLVSIGLDRAMKFWDVSHQYRSDPLQYFSVKKC